MSHRQLNNPLMTFSVSTLPITKCIDETNDLNLLNVNIATCILNLCLNL